MIKIFCHNCKKHLYNKERELIIGDGIRSEEYIPANNDVKSLKSDQFVCPFCDTPLINGNWKILTDKGLLPK